VKKSNSKQSACVLGQSPSTIQKGLEGSSLPLFSTRLFLAVVSLFLALGTSPAVAKESSLVVQENEISIEIVPAEGEFLVIWLVDHEEQRPQFEMMLKAISNGGNEIWRIDLLADYFIPRSSENVRTLSGDGIAALLTAAHLRTSKQIILAAYDRMSLPLLRGVQQWQVDYHGPSRLAGAVLFYPNLFGPPPVAGQDAELDPIVRSTNIPVVVYQPALGSHRWRLSEVMTALWSGGSPAFSYIVPGVRDWFFMHPPDQDPLERTATKAVPDNLRRLSLLLSGLPKPPKPAELTGQQAISTPVRGLVPIITKMPAPPFDLVNTGDGRVRLEDYRNRVTLVNFWATWCPPCVEEVPSLNRLISRYSDREFSVVSIDFRESERIIRDFVRKFPVNFPILLDQDGRVAMDWKVFGFPSSFILDRQGNIRYSVNRAIEWNVPEVLGIIDGLLKEDEEKYSHPIPLQGIAD